MVVGVAVVRIICMRVGLRAGLCVCVCFLSSAWTGAMELYRWGGGAGCVGFILGVCGVRNWERGFCGRCFVLRLAVVLIIRVGVGVGAPVRAVCVFVFVWVCAPSVRVGVGRVAGPVLGGTPLHLASLFGHVDAIKCLVELKAEGKCEVFYGSVRICVCIDGEGVGARGGNVWRS